MSSYNGRNWVGCRSARQVSRHGYGRPDHAVPYSHPADERRRARPAPRRLRSLPHLGRTTGRSGCALIHILDLTANSPIDSARCSRSDDCSQDTAIQSASAWFDGHDPDESRSAPRGPWRRRARVALTSDRARRDGRCSGRVVGQACGTSPGSRVHSARPSSGLARLCTDWWSAPIYSKPTDSSTIFVLPLLLPQQLRHRKQDQRRWLEDQRWRWL